MPEIPVEETPIYAQLKLEEAARTSFQRFFEENPLPEDYTTALRGLAEMDGPE